MAEIAKRVVEFGAESIQCKMGLTSLHDFYGSLFGHSTFLVASLVFMKGTFFLGEIVSLDCVMAKFYRS